MKYSTIPSARNLVLDFKSRGIKDIVISPGSRNAPLILSFSADPFFNCFSIVDERSAAFFALGMAQNQRLPVAVVCTSGSALLNYYPAVAEAFYSDVPLIVVSADRPPYKIDVGDGQTIRQDHVFHRHIGYSANLLLDVAHASNTVETYDPEYAQKEQTEISAYNDGEIFKALDIALNDLLPVHINIPFEEPLYALEEYDDDKKRAPQSHKGHKNETIHDIEVFRGIWRDSTKKMVLVGVNYPNEIEQELLDVLADDPSVLVFTETTSNLHHPKFFPSIDSIIFPIEKSAQSDEKFEKLRPEVLLTFGGLVVSKKIKAFLRKFKPTHHWHVNEIRAFDTYFSLTKHFTTTPQNFLGQLLHDSKPNKSDYNAYWQQYKLDYIEKRKRYLEQSDFSDYKAFGIINPIIPKGYQVHLSNSSTVRYSQLFDVDPALKIFCNRGTSGIDGSTSTAIGAAYYETNPTLLITGDLSFFYDSNALWNEYLRKDFRIILINNSGGGIFRILPGNDGSRTFEQFLETKHQLTAQHICAQFGVSYNFCNDLDGLKNQLKTFFEPSKTAKLLEVLTPRVLNDKILLGYFDFIS